MDAKTLLAVWAHPDDESFGPVGTVRLARDLGWRTVVVSATRGDAGSSDLVELAPGQTLGELREAELRQASMIIGVDRLIVWRYRDGGLGDVPREELIGRVLDVMRETRPAAVITFGPDGITGHPDHIAISDATTHAFHRLRDESRDDAPRRLYYVTVRPERTIEKPMGDAPPPLPPTAVIDVRAYESIKRAALERHASQRGDWEPLLEDRDWLTVDRFARVVPPPLPGAPIETTIFDG
jgi:N-acetylglucosamine malate deacetylase 2